MLAHTKTGPWSIDELNALLACLETHGSSTAALIAAVCAADSRL
jgi:hypothetical protein